MLKVLKWILGLFSSYVHPFERKVDRFFRGIKSTDSISTVKKRLLELMQGNLVVLSVWMERKYKGYVYLSKGVRRRMYRDIKKIEAELKVFESDNVYGDEEIRAKLVRHGLSFPNGDEEKIRYIYLIMQFLKPGVHYRYIRTASFGKLLRDPAVQKLEGDCNQIVTLYMYLYSLRFPLENLEIKLLPEHVCLHFRNMDIECTNGSFHNYTECEEVLPATEIVATNLLDLTDFREDVQEITSHDLVKSAQLAHATSSLRPLVEKNLKSAYHNLAVGALKGNDYKTAVFYFSKEGNDEALKNTYHNAALYYMKHHNFKRARYFASESRDDELEEAVKRNEGVYYYNNNKIDSALKIFTSLHDSEMKKACYAKQYNELVKKVRSVKTLKDVRRYRSTYKKMLDLARKMGDSSLESSVRETLSKI
ncbi:hypothetical protein HN709_02200 [Candidatus Peregrinibacteria bacterium]|nr:hypothetical protein [Candidatus Peregrinibacteria bacterium]